MNATVKVQDASVAVSLEWLGEKRQTGLDPTRTFQIAMPEGARHAVDLGSSCARLARDAAPGIGRSRNLGDDRSGLHQAQPEIAGRGFEQVERAGFLVKVDICREHQLRRNKIAQPTRQSRKLASIALPQLVERL